MGNTAVTEKKLKKEALVTYGKYDVGAIIKQVTNGNGSMPAFGDKLGPNDIEQGQSKNPELRQFSVIFTHAIAVANIASGLSGHCLFPGRAESAVSGQANICFERDLC